MTGEESRRLIAAEKSEAARIARAGVRFTMPVLICPANGSQSDEATRLHLAFPSGGSAMIETTQAVVKSPSAYRQLVRDRLGLSIRFPGADVSPDEWFSVLLTGPGCRGYLAQKRLMAELGIEDPDAVAT